MGSFNKIVAEQRLGWKTVAQNGVERSDIVNSLAVVSALVKVVLLYIRNGTAVGVQSGCIGEGSRENRCRGAGQGDGNAGLDDRIASGAHLCNGIDPDLVAWMGDSLHHSSG